MFKKGDRVKVVEGSSKFVAICSSGLLEIGDTGTIEEDQRPMGSSVMFTSDSDGYTCLWFARRFEKIKDKQEKPMTEDTYKLTVASPEFIDYRRIYKETIADGVRVARVKTAGKQGSILMVEKKILDQAHFRIGGASYLRRLHELGVYEGRKKPPVHLPDKEWGYAYSIIKKLVVSPLITSYKEETTVTVEPIKLGGI